MNNVPETIKASLQALVDGLTPLAEKLQVPIESIWTIAIKHNYAIAVSELLTWLICLGILVAIVKRLATLFEKDTLTLEEFDVVQMIVGSVFGIGLALTLITGIEKTVIRFIAPEWSTAQDLINLFKDIN